MTLKLSLQARSWQLMLPLALAFLAFFVAPLMILFVVSGFEDDKITQVGLKTADSTGNIVDWLSARGCVHARKSECAENFDLDHHHADVVVGRGSNLCVDCDPGARGCD